MASRARSNLVLTRGVFLNKIKNPTYFLVGLVFFDLLCEASTGRIL